MKHLMDDLRILLVENSNMLNKIKKDEENNENSAIELLSSIRKAPNSGSSRIPLAQQNKSIINIFRQKANSIINEISNSPNKMLNSFEEKEEYKKYNNYLKKIEKQESPLNHSFNDDTGNLYNNSHNDLVKVDEEKISDYDNDININAKSTSDIKTFYPISLNNIQEQQENLSVSS